MSSQSEMPISQLFTQNTEAVFALSPDGDFRQVSPAFARLLGQPADALPSGNLTDYLPAAEQSRGRQLIDRAAAGEVVCYEGPVLHSAGTADFRVNLFPLLADNRVAGVYGVACSLNEQEQTSRALRAREHQLAVIFDSIADVTFVLDVEPGGKYRFTFANLAFQKATGLPLERVIGSYVQDIIPAASLALMRDNYEKAARTCQQVVWLETSDYPTGRVTGEVTVTPVLDENGECCQLVGIVHDLTRQQKVEEALRVSNERFQYAIKATTDALYDWNVKTDTLYWGEGYEMLFGHQLKENPEPFSRWAERVLPAEKQRVVGGLRHMAYETTDWHWQEEYRFRRADGSWARVYDRGYILRDEHGQPVRMIGAMQDISERWEAQERQRLMSERLFRQNSDLQQFTYIVSHNLRAPLANALGFSGLLAQVEPGAEVFRESLRNLHTSLQQLDGILIDLNTVLSVRDQRGGYRAEPVALAAVCREAAHGLEQPLQACGGHLHCAIAEDLRLPGNRAYFHSIFHNLISNAIKYRSDARPLRVDVVADTDDDQNITIRVRDNGRGFDLAAAGDTVFQLYQRFHSDKKGRGIGLFLVKAHVESMGGRVSVESQKGIGTQFDLYFSSHEHENLPD